MMLASPGGPMLEQVEQRLGQPPQRLLVDTHYATQQDIVDFAARGIKVYTPVPPNKKEATAESQRKRAWRRQRTRSGQRVAGADER